jgi:hypothetical protein
MNTIHTRESKTLSKKKVAFAFCKKIPIKKRRLGKELRQFIRIELSQRQYRIIVKTNEVKTNFPWKVPDQAE